jgi:hypothetical protein
MCCLITCESEQSEFEFFQQLNNLQSNCAGPLTIIAFTQASLAAITSALLKSGQGLGYLDSYQHEVLDSSHSSFIMCAKHWIETTQKIGKVGVEFNNEIWLQLSFYIFRVLCLTNDWDYKEIVNYLKTLHILDSTD